MSEKTTIEKVTEITAQTLGVDQSKIMSDSEFVQDLEADSLDVVELVMTFEETFEIDIPDDKASDIVSINDAVSFIDKMREEKA